MTANKTFIIAIVGALLAISEVLSFIPSIKANGVFQLIVNILKTLSNM